MRHPSPWSLILRLRWWWRGDVFVSEGGQWGRVNKEQFMGGREQEARLPETHPGSTGSRSLEPQEPMRCCCSLAWHVRPFPSSAGSDGLRPLSMKALATGRCHSLAVCRYSARATQSACRLLARPAAVSRRDGDLDAGGRPLAL
ncbi:hypothetical protein AAFF_G00435330 [Aldrovandia affinis]|uniref:Secreted protein n=1 Tax=Aldrovandia affinis TaxID=143900 RepID=A0AAD7WJ12_9TELE|nr:hypothetical protein AAFF_G00435330 [Aldrovandia affinis]